MHQPVEIEARTRTPERNRDLFEEYARGWDYAGLGIAPDPKCVDGYNRPDPERAEEHRRGHRDRMRFERGMEGETPSF